jgi:hypothetical protein
LGCNKWLEFDDLIQNIQYINYEGQRTPGRNRIVSRERVTLTQKIQGSGIGEEDGCFIEVLPEVISTPRLVRTGLNLVYGPPCLSVV